VIGFYSPGLKLAVEIDGDSHFQQDSNDENRQDYIQTFGIRFLRFTNEEVFNNLEGVLEAIFQIAQEGTPKTSPSGESTPYEGGDIGEVV